MIGRDLHSNIKTVQHLAAAAYTTTQTPANGVNRAGFSMLEFLIAIGVVSDFVASPVGDGSWTFKLQESDDDSAFTDVVTAADVLVGSAKSPVTTPNASTGIFLTVDADAEDVQVYRIGYIGAKQYVRVVSTAVSTPGSSPLAIIAVLGNPAIAPTAD